MSGGLLLATFALVASLVSGGQLRASNALRLIPEPLAPIE
ncbi:hypothetical protein SAMN06265367_1065 [Algoriphagus winogradskyi]|uniref:Uncharacterized protein n=1 Tax=Algoriphagus winogradskyi TaxID=237017 RepID=A0ABY1P7Q8_9BACT|nr:hypothetical protein SAMN06265367_1065 [Algoriphagus winogradskyi]